MRPLPRGFPGCDITAHTSYKPFDFCELSHKVLNTFAATSGVPKNAILFGLMSVVVLSSSFVFAVDEALVVVVVVIVLVVVVLLLLLLLCRRRLLPSLTRLKVDAVL